MRKEWTMGDAAPQFGSCGLQRVQGRTPSFGALFSLF
jgi:hypothetical protein